MDRRLFLSLFLCVFLGAYELSVDSYRNYTVMDPELRGMGLIYPQSWLQPGDFLFSRNYEDSSFTYGRWDQLFYADPQNGMLGFSADVTVKYVPYSFPQRWSAAVEWLHYRGPSSSDRSDAVLHYRHQRGEVEYFHTRNSQKLQLQNDSYVYDVRSQGLTFRHRFTDKLGLSGGIDFNMIEQQQANTANHDVFHQYIEMQYNINRPLSVYGILENRYFRIDEKGIPMRVFRPGVRYRSEKFFAHLALRIAPGRLFPIAQIGFRPGPFSLEAYAKVRNPQFIIGQMANQYIGIKSSLNLNKKHHSLKADAGAFYDFPPAAQIFHDSIPDPLPAYYGGKILAEYRFKTRSVDLYGRGSAYYHVNPPKGYYHPEIAAFTLGMEIRTKPAGGKMRLDGDLYFQTILHENPDNVSFDGSGLFYLRSGNGDPVLDFKAALQLRMRIQSFALVWDLSAPLKPGGDLQYYLYQGVYTSSDFRYGNTFFTALSLEWYWWK
ncbi:MAG: hypothetical protein WC372_01405 [Candidatus Neomarinimicrobiota bacterium]|nr:hypothetical protein [Candidatus Neomarinimicrobiota bacterium]MDD3965689.1 hypothetical protein [Candidatus Neomarinimicrobiota bacterium]MDX9780304.1 hypothetical protein [bacterium]